MEMVTETYGFERRVFGIVTNFVCWELFLVSDNYRVRCSQIFTLTFKKSPEFIIPTRNQ